MRSDPPIYRRQDLYDQVWAEPIREVGMRESSIALARWRPSGRRTCIWVANLGQRRPSVRHGGPLVGRSCLPSCALVLGPQRAGSVRLAAGIGSTALITPVTRVQHASLQTMPPAEATRKSMYSPDASGQRSRENVAESPSASM